MDYVQIKHRVLTGLRALRFSSFELIGPARGSGNTLRVLIAGNESFRHYFKGLAFAGPVVERDLGRTTPWKIRSDGRNGRHDLVIFRSHRALADINFFGSGFFVPEWLSGETNLDAQRQAAESSRSRKRDLRQLDKNEMHYTVTRKVRELDFFFNEMYVPHIRRAHGAGALLMGYDQMMQRLERGETELVLIWQGTQRVAGSLIVYDAGQPRLFSEGVLHADKTYLRAGAGAAVYLYSFDHLRQRGFKRVNLGRSRAFLSDGVLYFKERFGLTLTEPSDSGVFILPTPSSSAAAAFLQSNAFIHVRGHRLRGAVFNRPPNAASPNESLTFLRRMQALGIPGVETIDLAR